MTITFAITVSNEFIEIQKLIHHLLKYKRLQDNIVVLYDEAHGDNEVENFLRSHSINGEFSWHKDNFNGNFAEWKNKLKKLCSGDYIFFIDADEIPHQHLVQNINLVIEMNPEAELFWLPRENYVEGITQEHINKWGWKINENKQINYPDPQSRIVKNIPSINWENKVHEQLKGNKNYIILPLETEWSLVHSKSITKQEKQNSYYDTL